MQFHRPQADLVRNRDYSFAQKGNKISVNTLGKRAIMSYDAPECFAGFFDGSWTFGTGTLVSLLGEWYLHIPATREVDDATLAELDSYAHIVGIDRGIRFLSVSYDEKGKTSFVSGREIMENRQSFADVRVELQSRGTKSAKRALKDVYKRQFVVPLRISLAAANFLISRATRFSACSSKIESNLSKRARTPSEKSAIGFRKILMTNNLI